MLARVVDLEEDDLTGTGADSWITSADSRTLPAHFGAQIGDDMLAPSCMQQSRHEYTKSRSPGRRARRSAGSTTVTR
jgi:hypothetical protein